jgi:hypothetical protein
MKVGDKLIALDECVMTATGSKTLTIGNEYEVIQIYDDEFSIIDDEGDEHEFEYDDYQYFFELKHSIPTDKYVDRVLNRFKERSEVGIKKYSTTLERNDLNVLEWLTHLQEELMDATLYIERLKDEQVVTNKSI